MVSSPTVLLHAANETMLETNAVLIDETRFVSLTKGEQKTIYDDASLELHYFTSRFLEKGWNCYWYVLKENDVEPLHLRDVYDVRRAQRTELPLKHLNEDVDVVVARIVGSVEKNRSLISRYLRQLRDNFAGRTINNPDSALYGLRKDYLLEFIKAGINTIPTDYYPNNVTLAELYSRYKEYMDTHIIKPVTGELSNSLAVLGTLNEETLRWKEPKVGGWLVQPLVPQIWEGEYQLFFIGNACTHGNRKVYERRSDDEILPNQHDRRIEPYTATAAEIALAKELREFWRDQFGHDNDLYRLDFIKQADGAPLVLEFETVNPGFFIRYIDEDRRTQIASAFEAYLAQECVR